jgi:hypothetical protein
MMCLSSTNAPELRGLCSDVELSKSAMRKLIVFMGLGCFTVNSMSRCAHRDGEDWSEDERD